MSESSLKAALNFLIAQREALEVEADAIGSELKSPGLLGQPPAGIHDSLIDSEGFPRGDIDIYNVKSKRKRLAEINVDYKILMKQIEESMLQVYKALPADNRLTAGLSATHENTNGVTTSTNERKPLAKLDQILVSSPAHSAGICEGDLLLEFGDVTSSTPHHLSAIAKLVGESLNKPIDIVVSRPDGEARLTITPATWGGRGLLGCHLTPM
jgi:26S proteasome non-ATPase regulatory subunit 9